MSNAARVFLDCYAQGKEPEGGWTFGKALSQARLDYSHASLERVNTLLDQIRAKVKPEREAFLSTPGGRNFCDLLAYSLVSFVVKKSGARIGWHDFASAQQVLGSAARLAEGTQSRIVAIARDVGVALLPLVWIEDKLFGAGLAPTCANYVAGCGARLDHAGPVAWAAAVHSLGFLASYSMFMVSGGAVLVPTLLRPDADGERFSLVAMFDDTADGALQRGRAALAQEEGGPRHAAFACEASVGLPKGRTAIVVELRCHGDNPLAVTVVFPYRAATDPHGFAIFKPQLIEGSVPAEAEGLFNRSLEAGIQHFNWPSGSWARFRDAAQAVETQARQQDRGMVAYADGQHAMTGDAVLSGRGLFPSCVIEVGQGAGESAGLRIELCNGTRQTLSPDEARDTLVFVARQSPDFVTACVRFLQQQTVDGPLDQTLRGAPHAQFALGNLQFHGLALERDQRQGLCLWQSAADSGYAPAEREMGIIYLEGGVLAPNPSKGLGLLRRAVDKGDPVALTRLAMMYQEGWEVARDEAKAVTFLRHAAAAGFADAQYQLAMCFQDGRGVVQDYELCVQLYVQAAAQGHAASINSLADKYEHGLGVAQDFDMALSLYRNAAEKNVIAAWYSLAGMYADGRGVARDVEQAVRWMKLAAEHDFLDAKARLRAMVLDSNAALRSQGAAALLDASRLDAGTLYELAGRIYTHEIAESLPVAFLLYLQAANKGHADAQLQVAFRYRRGFGVEMDVPQAIRWYQRAMASGSPYAGEDMGEIFEYGELVPKDLRRAAELYAKAIEAGSLTARDRLEALQRSGVATPDPGKVGGTGKPGWKFWY